MERFVKFACYCRRTRNDNNDNAPTTSSSATVSSPHVAPADPSSSSAISAQNAPTEASLQWRNHETERDDDRTGDGTRPLWNFLQRLPSGDNLFKSVQVFLLGNVIFL